MNGKKKEVEGKLSATEIKRNLLNALTLCNELRRRCEEGMSSVSNESISSLIASCDSVKDQLDTSMEFINTPSKRTDVLNKLLRTERKRRWRLKRRRLGRVKRTFFRSMLVQRNQFDWSMGFIYRQLDMWRKEREQQMEEEQEEERKREAIFEKEIQIQHLLKQRTDLQKLLLSVDSLRRIRIQKLRNQGYLEESGTDPVEEGLLRTCKKEVEGYKEVTVSKKKSEW